MSETSFSYGEFNTVLQEVGDYLAELRYIDLALAYIDSRHQHPSGSGGPQWDYLRIPLGTTQPFTRDLGFFLVLPREVFQAEVEADLAVRAGDASTWAAANIMSLREAVRPIVSRSVEAHDTLINVLDQTVRKDLNQVRRDFGGLSNNLGDWKGDAAEAFADEFYTPVMTESVRNQLSFVDCLLATAAVAKADLRFSQTSVLNALTAARAALREQLTHRSTNDNLLSTEEFLTVGAVMASAVAVLFPGGIVVGTVGFVVSTGITLAAAALPEKPDEEKIIGGTAADLEESLGKAIIRIVRYYNQANSDLYDRLRDVKGEMEELYEARLLTPARPAIADDDVSGEDFYHRSR